LREIDESALAGIVVGLPRRLSGEETDQTTAARVFAAALSRANAPPVHLQDERLSSHEAERLLAEREPDWRLRKRKLDAAAAAVILQDFLDGRARATPVELEGN
jgi:putative Holliday junction resolvase